MKKIEIPKLITEKKKELVIDARICKISGCKFFKESQYLGQEIYNCQAGVYQARLPKKELDKQVKENPSSTPGYKEEYNPYILRFLMSPDCIPEQCGITEIKYYNRTLDVEEENKEKLFKDYKDNL